MADEVRAAAVSSFAAALTVLILMFNFSAQAEETEWLQGNVVELQALDKITARIATLEAEVGTPFRYGTLMITVHACTFRPPTLAPEKAAFLEIRTVDHRGAVSEAPVFNGWMFASSPAVNALEHPVYDVSVLACRKA